ncbi:organic solute transporter subunit alpha-like [Acanthaster planci]|uniref:Organic solute transporter subunit alpha-like n=1 Tax=Acanthaster planci TaxID=133434 RepID=A0A8B7ZUB7_ACAPL|nr:organic solute transporter subunit alpha-like [Acanthaster planci]
MDNTTALTEEQLSGAPYTGTMTGGGTADNSTDGTLPIPACLFNPHVPTTSELITVVMKSPSLIFMMILALLLVFLTVLMYVEGQVYICKKIPGRRKVHLSFIFSLYPVFSTTSLCGFYIPKAHIVAKFTSEIWLSLVLFQFVLLVSEYYGTSEKMLLVLHGRKIPLAGPPCCCCCCCFLPSVLINEKNIGKFSRRVKILVLQVAVLRPILWFIAIILWINGNYNEGELSINDAYPYMTLIALISNMVALQALVTFFRISQDPLSSYKVKPKFFTVQLVLIITSIQSVITGALAKFGVIKCLGPYNSSVNGKMIVDFTVIVEMFFFMILAALWYRRVEGNVDHDLIERQTYKRLSETIYKRNPREQIMLQRHNAPNDGEADMTTTPSPVPRCQPDGIWLYRGMNGDGLASANGLNSASDCKMDKLLLNCQKEPLLNNTSGGKALTHIQLPSTFAMDNFASSRETDV